MNYKNLIDNLDIKKMKQVNIKKLKAIELEKYVNKNDVQELSGALFDRLKKMNKKDWSYLLAGLVALTALFKFLRKLSRLTKRESLGKVISNTLKIRLFSLFKIPLIFYCSPIVEELNEERCAVRIPLKHKTRNHLNSMYFGVLAVGADCSGGIITMAQIRESKEKISLVFKDFKADFLKRPEEDVVFICEDGKAIKNLINKTISTGERENMPMKIKAYAASNEKSPVAIFELTLSLKKK